MTGLVAAVLAVGALALAIGWRLVGAPRRAARNPARAEIERLDDFTSVDPATGAVRSVQAAEVAIDEDALEQIWTPVHLERLARTYWRFLARVTLGLIRVRYTPDTRTVVLLASPFRLLTFSAPEYEIDATHGLVRWRIARGLLVARRGRGRGYLQIAVRREGSDGPARVRLHVEVEVANFYPAIASGISLRFYNITQSRIHVIITYGFLRSLVRLDLAESRVGQLSAGV